MADVVIDAGVFSNFYKTAKRGGPFWTSTTVGYVVFIVGALDLKYAKTVDGGATWNAVNIRVGGVQTVDCWADWQTAGDAGTKIHMVLTDKDTNDISYVYLDTSDDSVGGADVIETAQGTTLLHTTIERAGADVSITKTRGGNLVVAFRYKDSGSTVFYSCYTSPDGDTWTSEASPWEGDGLDYILLFPGNEPDNQDVWAAFWDSNASQISLKTYDDSGDSWSEQAITGNSNIRSADYIQMDGAIRLSDGHLIFAAWSRFDHATSDFELWDINGAGSITKKTNLITETPEHFLVSVFVDQISGDLYVAYVGGTSAQAEVAALYKKSTDGGTSWGIETAMQVDVEDDERWISCGVMKADWGGKFQPMWFNDDPNDMFTNSDNGILIASLGWSGGTFLGVSPGNIAKINGVSLADITKVNGVA